MTTPTRRLPLLALALVLAAGAHLAAGEEGSGAPPPDWFREHNQFLARDGGVFHTDNSAYRSEDEPWDAYGLAWVEGPSRQTLRGRLFGLQDGKDIGTFWEFFVFWHPEEEKAFMYQVGGDGTLGVGTVDPPAPDGSQRSEATFHAPDGSTNRVAHVAWSDGDIHRMESFNWTDGAWKPRRSYVWHRVKAVESADAGPPGS